METRALEISYKKKLTEAFEKYREDGDEAKWVESNCSVFDVTAYEPDMKIKSTFTLSGYEIVKAFMDINLKTVDIDKLWKMITLSAYDLLEDHI